MAVSLSPSVDLRKNSAKHLAFSSGYEVEILRLMPQNDIPTQSLSKGEI
jgi:hypothetical protein